MCKHRNHGIYIYVYIYIYVRIYIYLYIFEPAHFVSSIPCLQAVLRAAFMSDQVPPSFNRSPKDFARVLTDFIEALIDFGLVNATMDHKLTHEVDLAPVDPVRRAHHPELAASQHNYMLCPRCTQQVFEPPKKKGFGWRSRKAYRTRVKNGNMIKKDGMFIATRNIRGRVISCPSQPNGDIREWFIACNKSLPIHRKAENITPHIRATRLTALRV